MRISNLLRKYSKTFYKTPLWSQALIDFILLYKLRTQVIISRCVLVQLSLSASAPRFMLLPALNNFICSISPAHNQFDDGHDRHDDNDGDDDDDDGRWI